MGFLVFDDINTRQLGIEVSGSGSYDAPELDVTKISVLGRNGDVILENGKYNNIIVKYPATVARAFPEQAGTIRAAFASRQGRYYRLQDSYQPNMYRMARFKGPLNISTGFLNRSAHFTLDFDCKPQRWLTLGEEAQNLGAGGTMYNPTGFEARPLITVTGTGSGTLTVNGNAVTLSGISGSIVLDCDLETAYKGSTNMNSSVAGDFPVLIPGENTVSVSGLTAVEIIPRWWTL